MKKKIFTLLMICMLALVTGCQQITAVNKTIEIKEARAITQLATVECYFHNVAKSNESTNKAWYEFWEKENINFWIEYDGVVRIGIDASQLKIDIDGTTVSVTLPEAIVLDAKVNQDSLNEDSFYYDSGSKKPTANQQAQAFSQAQQSMIEAASSNKALLTNARENAKELIENYIRTIGEATGIDYTIVWIYPEEAN